MRLRTELQKEVERKGNEIRDLEAKITDLQTQVREARAYINGIQKAIKLLPPDLVHDQQIVKTLRPGSDAAKCRDFLRSQGKPLHVVEILEGIGKENTKENRISVSGSLAHYANNNEIFVKTAPRTFGLIEFLQTARRREESEDELPENFGKDYAGLETAKGSIGSETSEIGPYDDFDAPDPSKNTDES
jgi:predicted RNase H-like nuclease (RuvC/YqgF family)